MHNLILFALAILPPLIFLRIINWLDKKEKEPKKLIKRLFVFGAIAVVPIAAAELILKSFNFFPEGTVAHVFVSCFFNIAVCEELGKFLCMHKIVWKNKNFNYRYDAIVYSVAVSLGFATLENILYVFSNQVNSGDGLTVALSRMLLAIPAHLMFAIAMGVFYGPLKNAANKNNASGTVMFSILTLVVPIILHGIYDFCLMVGNVVYILLFFAFVIAMDIVGLIIIIASSKTDKAIVAIEQNQQSNCGEICQNKELENSENSESTTSKTDDVESKLCPYCNENYDILVAHRCPNCNAYLN